MMVSSKWRVAGGVASLVLGSVFQLVQFLVSPVKHADNAAAQVAAAAAHGSAMRWSIVLDVPILLVIPAVLYAGCLVRGSKLASIGVALTFTTALGAGYLLAQDIVTWAAARGSDRTAAVAVADAFAGNGVITLVTVAYLVGHTIGFILLGIALSRSRRVPMWAGIALCAWPFFEMAGEATSVTAVAALGFALLSGSFIACAVALVRAGRTGSVPETSVLSPVLAS
jgi:hypothetical protein